MTHLRRWIFAGAAALLLALAGPASAQDGEEGSADTAYTYGEADGAALSEAGFQAGQGTRPGDEVPGGLLMIAAYGLMGTLLMGYVIVLVRRQRAVGDELDVLRRRMAEMDDRLEDLERPSAS